ncbi:electron transport complex subunit RsxC [Alkalilimnicola sp. S0819]|uniref:electron transport complex subunit RsxC n=1 Tax=Alkalilimnicola sp. S0819 TaxID=2613922 RepID=UPI0012617AFE|nr:electron transport complex subunit RsxC [Alkalilimnicola sp. S0819]KAB7623199.1 electron transport complex subunit RsxC [Alkalilimnicola sp. S0819]MPQ17045.1 electron transport complex subunit RsxC [Alkalilimnicola sp. S0819]
MNKLFRFPGGLRLAGRKKLSNTTTIRPAPVPAELTVPLGQHIGAVPEVLVKVGDTVGKGQMLARPDGYVSAAVHAPSSGTVTAIESRPVPHPSGLSAPCVVIRTDGEDRWAELPAPISDWEQRDPAELRQRVREAGIVGLGGAAFPSSVKLNPGPGAVVEDLILNGAECEPYISCDDRLMRERAEQIVGGLRIIRHALQARRCTIGVEDNKPEAIAALREALSAAGERDVAVAAVPTRYPAGGEKQLIQVLTGREVPSGGLPLQIGVVCHNVGTAAAVYQAVVEGRPLISRVLTVTGAGVAAPANLEVRIGTPFSALIEYCGGYTPEVDRLLMGGPMMGFAVQDDLVPVIKATNCVLAGSGAEFPRPAEALPCIRCGACADACPVSLLPQQLYWHARAGDFDKTQEHELFDCIECGACAYVCPSQIPLVQYFRYAKSEIAEQERERKKADLARDRYEFRLERLEREKQEQAEKRRKKKEALRRAQEAKAEGAGGEKPAVDKQAAIQAALKRAEEKKAAKARASAEASNEESD